MTIITIDGNIGSGKTSVLNYLHKMYKIPIDIEPVEAWSPYLLNMYNNKNNVFKFQIRIWIDRCWIQEKSENTTILIERSPFFIKNAFINSALDLNMINTNEYNILLDLHKKTDLNWASNIYIYLHSNPVNCFKRINKRDRECEKNITEEYITILHNYHNIAYQNAIANNLNIICIEIDNKSIPEIATEILKYIQINNIDA